MKRFEIAIRGTDEEVIGMEILTAVYEAIQGHGYHDVSIQAETIPEKGGFLVPGFMKRKDVAGFAERGR